MIVTLEQVKAQVGQTLDVDDELLTRKIEAAQDHIENLLGFKIEDRFGGDEEDPVPPALVECVSQLAAHWYENREASFVGVSGQEIAFGVNEIVREFRGFTFG